MTCRLKDVLDLHGVSQRQLADAAGLRQATISHLSSGRAGGIEFSTAARLIDGLYLCTNRRYEMGDLFVYHGTPPTGQS